jgi:DNA-binding FadR family transcriptional regulator
VREAVRGLEAVGVVDIRRGSGLYVNQFSFEPLLDNLYYGLMFDMQELLGMLEIRHVLESGLIGKVIEQITDTETAQLKQALNIMRLTQNNDLAFIAADREFHQTLFACLENATLLKVLDAFWLTFSKAAEQEQEALGSDPQETFINHARIMDAVLARDLTAAKEALESHYAAVETRLRSLGDLEVKTENGDSDGR